MDFELLLGGQVGHVKCEQVQNVFSQNRLKPIPKLPISWKVSRVGQIWSQIEKLGFLEIWDVPGRIFMATIRRGTFMCLRVISKNYWQIRDNGGKFLT